ncbi:hypothetical protein N7517_009307 [Penicillium concentricum]|uniref:Uncharacterized protein n=1 Tax=Penicillium concentricum TaxID=293559 RepID=A0A9W9UZ22_9EURO|nr:uncharacterized protein N7517_009307 [Penicillium concentricum]KAJ5360116.1 hypothetical protein N7517_009307 [Penicillium concentricum]
MPRTTISLQLNMKSTPFKNQRIWYPLRLDDFHLPQADLDRQSVLDLIRSVYDPLLTTWLAEPGHTWQNMFQKKLSSNVFEQQCIARKGELPGGVQSIETDTVLGQILLDLLKYHRFTDPAWRVPSAAVPPAVPAANFPTPLDILAAAASAAQPPLATSALDMLAAAANAAQPPLATPALDILAAVASEAQPILATPALDILAAAAGTVPHLPVPGPAAVPAPVPSPITPAYSAISNDNTPPPPSASDITQAATPNPPTASDISQAATPIAPAASPIPPVASPAPGTKRGIDDETEQPPKKKQAVNPT